MRKNEIKREIAEILLGFALGVFLLMALYFAVERKTVEETKRQLQDMRQREWVDTARECRDNSVYLQHGNNDKDTCEVLLLAPRSR